MKTMIAASLTALLLPTALVVGAAAPTAAAGISGGSTGPGEPPVYAVDADGLEAKAPHRAKVFVDVPSADGTEPQGALDLVFVKDGGKSFEFSRSYPKQADGKKGVYNVRPLPKGRLTVIVTFTPTDTADPASSDVTEVRVEGARRGR
ncbi:exported hypothetical protein [Nocardioides sp. AX2bis]|nr:exported hypothetical protein [Nocardioides sp. AX2bis]